MERQVSSNGLTPLEYRKAVVVSKWERMSQSPGTYLSNGDRSKEVVERFLAFAKETKEILE